MDKNYQVIVAGGGWAGAAAAIAATRQGAKTLLIEKSGFLGGSSGNHLVNPFMPNKVTINGVTTQLSQGLFTEICTRMAALDGFHPKHKATYNEEILKLVLDRMTTEAGVKVLFHSYICGVKTENGKIRSISCVNKSGTQTFFADCFVDATGDADVAAMAGCPCRVGRKEDGLCQPMTLCFRLGNVDVPTAFANSKKINALYAEFRAAGKIKNPREDVLKFHHVDDNVLHLNSTRVIKRCPVDAWDVSEAEREAREQMFELYTFLKENCAGFENAVLLSSAPAIGARESRMIDGRYVLTVEDLKSCTIFKDCIAACNYDIDIHNPAGSGTDHYYFKDDEYYTIPYRALSPQKVDNLLVAGRCISSTHEAQASYRIMPVCCTLGEAAGIAAAMAAVSGVATDAIDVAELQSVLRENGAFLGFDADAAREKL